MSESNSQKKNRAEGMRSATPPEPKPVIKYLTATPPEPAQKKQKEKTGSH
ncbi:MAG: hypothetical protein ACLPY5_15785 [Candidatus Bathyarchaeia archaeon]